jgi:glucose/arabinose dehydrogenase
MVLDDGSLGNEGLLGNYYAYGIRNSFGIDFDPVTGLLWDTENGPDYGDEINLVEQGFNSGWNTIQGTGSLQSFDPNRLVQLGGKGEYSEPEFEWIQPIGPTAIRFLTSDKLGVQYLNDMFVGDINNGHIYRFEVAANRTSLTLNGTLADRIANTIQEREQSIFGSGFIGISDIQNGPDGYLYVVSLSGGKIYRVVPQ